MRYKSCSADYQLTWKGIVMKKIIIILVLAISPIGIIAQTADKNLAMTRKEKRNEETQKQYELNKYMVENKYFVLEADRLQDRHGN